MTVIGNASHKMITVPNLTKRMAQKKATIADLAKVAGVSKSTIELARKGKPIHLTLAGHINTALETHKFAYTTVGRKGKGMKTLPQHPDANSVSIKTSKMSRICNGDNPDLVHTIRTSKPNMLYLPIDKTEAEVERMWAYNKMMGRC